MNVIFFLNMILIADARNVTIATSKDYSGIGSFDDVPARGTAANLQAVRRDYKFRLVNTGSIQAAMAGKEIFWPTYYQIDIRIEPCSNFTLSGGRGDSCCSSTGEINCQDTTTGVHAGQDMQIAYVQNAHVSTCLGTEFEDDLNCGTFIEIHRVGTELTDSVAEVLADIRLENLGGSYNTDYVSTAHLCAGQYELWWVVRTRSGPYVQHRKPFDILTPTC